MKGLDAALAKYPFLDGTRVAAAGASYGGYMIDWIASQAKGRFKSLICHAGVYDITSMYAGPRSSGSPRQSTRARRGATGTATIVVAAISMPQSSANTETPTLVTCGEIDYRVPYTQSLEFFTALQRQEVPSRLIVFPDEGHWILKPENSVFWYQEGNGLDQEVLIEVSFATQSSVKR